MIRVIVSTLLVICLSAPSAALADDVLKKALESIPADAVGFVCAPSSKIIDQDFQQTVKALGLEPFVHG